MNKILSAFILAALTSTVHAGCPPLKGAYRAVTSGVLSGDTLAATDVVTIDSANKLSVLSWTAGQSVIKGYGWVSPVNTIGCVLQGSIKFQDGTVNDLTVIRGDGDNYSGWALVTVPKQAPFVVGLDIVRTQ